MTTIREPDPEGDAADEGQIKAPSCAHCGGAIDADGFCIDPFCPGYDDEEPDEPDYEEGLLGEDDDA